MPKHAVVSLILGVVVAGCAGGKSLTGMGGTVGRAGAGGTAAGGTLGLVDVTGFAGTRGFAGTTGSGGSVVDCGVWAPDGAAPDVHALGQVPAGFGLRAARHYGSSDRSSLTLADVTGDGRPDLIEVADRIRVFASDATGQLGPPVDMGAGSSDTSVLQINAADLNGDGRNDLLLTLGASIDVDILLRVMLNDGHGRFSALPDLDAGSGIASLALGDVDGDGDLDVAVVSVTQQPGQDPLDSLELFLNAGDGTFAEPSVRASGAQNPGIAVGDVDGDRQADVVLTDSTQGTVRVFLSTGGGGLASPVTFACGEYPAQVSIGDLDGDGKADLLVLNGLWDDSGSSTFEVVRGTVSVLLNKGAASFAAPVAYPVGVSPLSQVLADLDGDGKLDVAVTNDQSPDLSVLYNLGDGTFSPDVRLAVGGSPITVFAGDLDRDSKPELVVTDADGNVSVVQGGGRGALGAGVDVLAKEPRQTQPPEGLGGTPVAFAFGDLNGDGKPDLVMTDSDVKQVVALLNRGDGTFGDGRPILNVEGAAALAIGDVDGDGKADLAAAVETYSCIYTGNGDGTFEFGSCTTVDGNDAPVGVAIGDLNGDGWPDLFTAQASGGSVLTNNGDGTLTTAKLWFGTGLGYAVIADLDGDGRPEVVLADQGKAGGGQGQVHGTVGDIHVIKRGANGVFGETIYSAGGAPSWLAVGDLDGDGRPDLAVANRAKATCLGPRGTVSVLLADGNGGFRPAAQYGEVGFKSIAIADLDGDGHPDLVAVDDYTDEFRDFFGNMSVFFNDGRGGFSAPLGYATPGNATGIAAADLDGNGRTDLGVASSYGTVSLFLNVKK